MPAFCKGGIACIQIAATASQTGLNETVPAVLTSPTSGLPPHGGYPQHSASSVLDVATPSSLVEDLFDSATFRHISCKEPKGKVMDHVKKILEGIGIWYLSEDQCEEYNLDRRSMSNSGQH